MLKYKSSVFMLLLVVALLGTLSIAQDEPTADLGEPTQGEMSRTGPYPIYIRGFTQVFGHTWSYDAGIHAVIGEYQHAANGVCRLKSGMHTRMGVELFARNNRGALKVYNYQKVEQFAEWNLSSNTIYYQNLPNGVRRIQLPQTAWAKEKAARVSSALTGGLTARGIKTLWPDNYKVGDIENAIDEVLQQNAGSDKQKIFGQFHGIRLEINRNADGEIMSSFPSWNQ